MTTEDDFDRVIKAFVASTDAEERAAIAAYGPIDLTRGRMCLLAKPPTPPEEISSGGEAYQWFKGAMAELLEAAVVIPHNPHNRTGHQGDRARCPLCGGGARGNLNRLEPGYAYPEGLWRHLMGQSNSPMCEIAAGVLEEAHGRWRKPVG